MRFAALLVIGLTSGIRGLAAQGPVIPGQRVRITSQQYRLDRTVGRVLASTNDTVTIGVERGSAYDTLALALADLDRLETGHYIGHRTRRGAWIGLGAGAAIGFMVGVATYRECVPQGWFDCMWSPDSPAQQGFLGAVVVGCVGVGVGGIIGAMTRAEQWDEIPTRHTTVSVRSLPMGGVGLGVAVRF